MNRSPLQMALAGAVILALIPPLTATPAGWSATPPSSVGAPSAANRLYQEGLQHFNNERLQQAITAWEQALAAYRASADAVGEALTLQQLGFVYYWQEQYAKALAAYSQALTITRGLGGNNLIEGRILAGMADVHFYSGHLAAARHAALESLRRLQNSEQPEKLWLLRYRLGEIAFKQQANSEALGHYQQALVLARRSGDSKLEMMSLDSIGLVLTRLGRYGQVIEILQQSLSIRERQGSQQGREQLLILLGLAYYWINDYAHALDAYNEALALVEANMPSQTSALLILWKGLGDVYYFLGDAERSLTYYQKSLKLARAVGDGKAEALSLLYLGQAALEQGAFEDSRRFFEQALALSRLHRLANSEANALAGLARGDRDRGRLSRSLERFQQALAIYRRIGHRYNEATTLRSLGQLELDRQRYPQAISAFRRSLAIARQDRELYGQASSLTLLGLALSRAADQRAAEASLRQAISANEAIRHKLGTNDALKVSLFDTQTTPYQALQAVLIRQGKIQEALEIAERARARAFVEQLQARRLDGSLAVTPLSAAEIQALARTQRATLVEYSLVGGKLFIYTVSPEGRIAFTQVALPASLPPLDTLVAASRGEAPSRHGRRSLAVVASTAGTGSSDSRAARRQLHQLLIQPIASQLPADPTSPLIVIPQGPLFLVPFAALEDATGTPLIEKHTLLTAPAIQVLTLLQPSRSRDAAASGGFTNSTALVAGNPTMPRLALRPGDPPQPLPPLPGAEQEAIAIARLFRTTPLIGPEATETTVVQRLPSARVVHLATHGLLNDSAAWGLPGAIALAPSQQDDGLLRAEEILKLRLNAELVVLSACDTGRGRITGDGVIGLSRSLLTAGARNVLVSLWAVPDAPTTTLMSAFYQRLAAGEELAQALRGAMLTLRRLDPDPIAWAAFTLIGPAR